MQAGQQIIVKGGTFPSGRLATVRHSDRYGAIIDVHGIGSFYIQRRTVRLPAGAIAINYGGYFLYSPEGRML